MPATLTADSFSISHSFLLLVLFSWKPFADFPFQGALWRANLPSLFLQFFQAFNFSNLAFGYPSFLSFFPSESNPSLPSRRFSPATSPYGSSFWVPGGNNLLFTSCCFPSSLVFLLHHWAFEKDISVLCFLCFLVLLSSCFNPTLGVLRIPRIPGPWRSLGSRPSSFYWTLFCPLILAGWAFFSFFPLFHGLWNLPLHGSWASNLLGLPSFAFVSSTPFQFFTFHGVGPRCYFFGLCVMNFWTSTKLNSI